MPPTVRALVEASELGVSVVAGARYLGRRVRWVHVSELADPTPYLRGGELLLSTGLGVPERPAEQAAYVARLASAGVVGLGIGAGFSQESVPEGVSTAAEEHGVPVLWVPKATPFIALSEFVGEALAREEHEELTRILDKQRELAKAALQPAGPRTVVETLAAALGGWVVLLDESGRARHAAPNLARRHVDRLAMELERLRRAGRASSFSLEIGSDTVLLHPLAVHGSTRGFLAVGTSGPPTAAQRSLAHMAVSLLSIDLVKSWSVRGAERAVRAALLRLVVAGQYSLSVSVADLAGLPMPQPPMRAALLTAPPEVLGDLLDHLEGDIALQVAGTLVAEADPRRIGLVTAAAEGDIRCLEAVLRRVPGARGGISEPVDLDAVGAAWRDAQRALDGGDQLGLLLARPRDVSASRLTGYLRSPQVVAWAEASLEPLLRHDRDSGAELVDTLAAFLRNTGQVDRAGAALGVHRHTVRYRLQKVEEILDCRLDEATTRSELWIALQLTDLVTA